MKSDKQFELLGDIAKLLSKYGPETFDALADSMNSPETTQRLVEVVRTTARISHSMPIPHDAHRDRNKVRSVRKEIDAIKGLEPEKHNLLRDFYQALQEKRALPTLVEMEDFAASRGLPPIGSNRRPTAIVNLIRLLIELPTADLKQKLSGGTSSPRHDTALRGWSEIILGKDRETQAAQSPNLLPQEKT